MKNKKEKNKIHKVLSLVVGGKLYKETAFNYLLFMGYEYNYIMSEYLKILVVGGKK